MDGLTNQSRASSWRGLEKTKGFRENKSFIELLLTIRKRVDPANVMRKLECFFFTLDVNLL